MKLSVFIPLLFVCASAWAAPFEPAATMRALSHDEARPGALRQLFILKGEDLAKAESDPALGPMLALVVSDKSRDFPSRVLAVRALARLHRTEGNSALASVLLDRDGEPETVALAREAAVTLRRFKDKSSNLKGIDYPDPEVRATAAATLADGIEAESTPEIEQALCSLMNDPWPEVRRAAASGLRTADCLKKLLADRDVSVVASAAVSAGLAGDAELVPMLEKIASGRKYSNFSRCSALRSLGQLGAFTLPRKILDVHLQKGGLEELAFAAVLALAYNAQNSDDAARLQKAANSKTPKLSEAAKKALENAKVAFVKSAPEFELGEGDSLDFSAPEELEEFEENAWRFVP